MGWSGEDLVLIPWHLLCQLIKLNLLANNREFRWWLTHRMSTLIDKVHQYTSYKLSRNPCTFCCTNFNVPSGQRLWDTLHISSLYTGCSLKIVFFPQIFLIFLNSANSAAALVFYLPGVRTRTDTDAPYFRHYFWPYPMVKIKICHTFPLIFPVHNPMGLYLWILSGFISFQPGNLGLKSTLIYGWHDSIKLLI